MKQIQADGFRVDIIRSKRRKTMAITVRHGKASLRMPARLDLSYGEQFVHAKSAWIKQKLQQQPAPLPRHFRDGESLLFQGEPHSLKLSHGLPRNSIKLGAGLLEVGTRQQSPSSTHIARLLKDWYKQQANTLLPRRTRELANQIGLQPRDIEIKTYRARWGSCALSGDIQLNWKLLMAPVAVIDYVIIHELCHLQHHNHSSAFWDLVETFEPNHRAHRAWLRQHGHQLDL